MNRTALLILTFWVLLKPNTWVNPQNTSSVADSLAINLPIFCWTHLFYMHALSFSNCWLSTKNFFLQIWQDLLIQILPDFGTYSDKIWHVSTKILVRSWQNFNQFCLDLRRSFVVICSDLLRFLFKSVQIPDVNLLRSFLIPIRFAQIFSDSNVDLLRSFLISVRICSDLFWSQSRCFCSDLFAQIFSDSNVDLLRYFLIPIQICSDLFWFQCRSAQIFSDSNVDLLRSFLISNVDLLRSFLISNVDLFRSFLIPM